MRNELLIGYSTDEMFSIDTIEGIDINITKNIYSIEDPSKRLSDFTKTIEVPGSKNNDNVFGALFDVNFHIRDAQQLNPDFNPARKAVCQYLQDEHIQIDGYCQLTDIKVLNENKVIYVIVIYGQNADLFSKIGDKTLNDIEGYGLTLDTPITSGTFNWNDTEIQASWSNPDNGYIYYPMLNRGQGFTYRGGPIPEWGVDYNTFKPWLYVRTIFTSIMSEAGYTWESNFIDSAHFKKLIMECDMSKFILDSASQDNSKAEANLTTSQSVSMGNDFTSYTPSFSWNNPFIPNTEVQDLNNIYDNTTGTITIPSDGYYTIQAKTGGRIEDTIGNAIAWSGYDTYLILKRAGVYSILATDHKSYTGSPLDVFQSDITITSNKFLLGDEIRMCAGRITGVGSTMAQVGYGLGLIGTIDVSILCYEAGILNYGIVYPINVLFHPMKQTDFFMGIVKMFNLYIEPQPNGTLLIEPRDEFYTDIVTDWTSKLDTSKDFVIKPQGLLNVKQIDFNYKKGMTDVDNSFNESTGYIFGYKRIIFNNDFVKDTKKVELPFILEPLQYQAPEQIVLMRTDYRGITQEKSPYPMIAYAGGLLSCLNYRYYDSGLNTYTTLTQYAYAGFLDNPDSPTKDLTFGNQGLYFHKTKDGNVYIPTLGDLWSQYHYRQWTEIGDRDSKLVECYMKLNTYDMANVSFRQAYWIDKAAYRLLEIQDYAPNGETTTKCIFLKLNLVDALTPSTTTTLGGTNGNGGQGGGSGGEHYGGEGGANGMNVQQVLNGIWQGGANNRIDRSVGVNITGNNNAVGFGCSNVNIQGGENNFVAPALSNVSLINCTDLNIFESDVLYINNIKIDLSSPTNNYVWTYESSSNSMKLKVGGGGSGESWTETTGTSDSMAINTNYIANNVALVTYTLPLSAGLAIGDRIRVKGAGTGGFKIAQNASQKIRWATGSETTIGVTGYIQSTDQNDYVELFYVATNIFSVGSVKGTFTIA